MDWAAEPSDFGVSEPEVVSALVYGHLSEQQMAGGTPPLKMMHIPVAFTTRPTDVFVVSTVFHT